MTTPSRIKRLDFPSSVAALMCHITGPCLLYQIFEYKIPHLRDLGISRLPPDLAYQGFSPLRIIIKLQQNLNSCNETNASFFLYGVRQDLNFRFIRGSAAEVYSFINGSLRSGIICFLPMDFFSFLQRTKADDEMLP